MRSIALRAVLALSLGSLACAHAPGEAAQGTPAPDDVLALSVSNNTWSDADVYVLASTMRARLGNVESMNTVRLHVPRDMWALGWIQVQVYPVGGGTPYTTDRIEVQGGQLITLNVEKQASLSTWVVDRMSSNW